jgi:hypothetical protein
MLFINSACAITESGEPRKKEYQAPTRASNAFLQKGNPILMRYRETLKYQSQYSLSSLAHFAITFPHNPGSLL